MSPPILIDPYQNTAAYGHFGCTEAGFAWEATGKAVELWAGGADECYFATESEILIRLFSAESGAQFAYNRFHEL